MNKVARKSTQQADVALKSKKKAKKTKAEPEIEIEPTPTKKKRNAASSEKIKTEPLAELDEQTGEIENQEQVDQESFKKADGTPKSEKKTRKKKAAREIELKMDVEMAVEVTPKQGTKRKLNADVVPLTDATEPTPTTKKRKAAISKKIKTETLGELDAQTAEIDNQEQVDQEAFEEGEQSDHDSCYGERDAVTFHIKNLPEPFTVGLKHELQAYFNKKGVSVQLRAHNIKYKYRSNCHAVLLNPNDKDKMAALNGKPFKDGELTISCSANTTSMDMKRIMLYNPDTKVVTDSGLKEASGAQNVFIWNFMGVVYLGFDNEEDAKKLVDAGSLTVGGHEMIAQYATARKKQYKNNDERIGSVDKDTNGNVADEDSDENESLEDEDHSKEDMNHSEEDEDRSEVDEDYSEEDDEGASIPDDNRVYFIGNLPAHYLTIQLELTQLLFQRGIAIKKLWHRRNRNFCYCALANVEDRDKILALHEFVWKDKTLRVRAAPTVEFYSEPKVKRTVDFFVGNLPTVFDGLQPLLKAFFEKKGVGVSEFRGGLQHKYCHCSLDDPNQETKMALLNGEAFHGSVLTIRPALNETGRRDPCKLILHGVNLKLVSGVKLKRLTDARFVKITRSKHGNGIGILTFADEHQAKRIRDKKYVELNGCKMAVDYAISWPSAAAAQDAAKRKKLKLKEAEKRQEQYRQQLDRQKHYKTPVGKGGNQPCYICGQKGHKLGACQRAKSYA